MHILFAMFIVPFLLLNTLGAVVAGIWLLAIGEWRPLLVGIGMMFAGIFLISFALMPGMLVSAGGIALHEKGGMLRPIGWLLMVTGLLWTFLIMTAWAGQLSLEYFTSKSSKETFWPLLIWSYSVATVPWAYMARKEMQSGENAAATSTFALQIGYVIAMVILGFGGNIFTAQMGLLVVMGFSFLFALAHTILLAFTYKH